MNEPGAGVERLHSRREVLGYLLAALAGGAAVGAVGTNFVRDRATPEVDPAANLPEGTIVGGKSLQDFLAAPEVDAEADANRAAAGKSRVETYHEWIQAEQTRQNADAARRKTLEELRQAARANRDESVLTILAKEVTPYAAGAVAVFTVLKTYSNNKRAERIAAYKADVEAKAQKQEATETRLTEIGVRLGSPDLSAWQGADVNLVGYTSETHAGVYDERVWSITTGVLRRRIIEPAKSPFNPAYENIVVAFRILVPRIRDAELRRRQAQAVSQTAKFSETYPTEAELSGLPPAVDARRVHLDGASLVAENLSNVNFDGASFTGAQLDLAEFWGSNLRGANFAGTDMQGVIIGGGSRIEGLVVAGAKLQGARLIELDYTDVDLEAAASLKGTLIDGTRGISEAAINRLEQKGAYVMRRTDYGEPEAAEGDMPVTDSAGNER